MSDEVTTTLDVRPVAPRPRTARVVIVAGKGGVGSSTVAAAEAVAAARRGADVLFVPVDGRPGMGTLLGGREISDREQTMRRFPGGVGSAPARSRPTRPSATTST